MVIGGEGRVENGAVASQGGDRGIASLFPAEAEESRQPGVEAGDADRLAKDAALAGALVGDKGRDPVAAERVGGGGRGGCEAALGGEDVVGAELVPDRSDGGVLDTLGDDGEGGHEREADHQCSGSGSGASWVAHRVGAGERAGGAGDPSRWSAEQSGERPRDAGRDRRNAEEQDAHAEAEQEQAAPAGKRRDEAAEGGEHDPERAERKRGSGPEAGEPRGREDRAFADGRDRRDAGGTRGGAKAREYRDGDPEQQ
jgi:hypothetical protein